jgi:hypothetical protein
MPSASRLENLNLYLDHRSIVDECWPTAILCEFVGFRFPQNSQNLI